MVNIASWIVVVLQSLRIVSISPRSGWIGELDGPAERIAEQLAVEMVEELLTPSREQVFAQAGDIGELRPVLELDLGVDGTARQVGLAAAADRVEPLEGEPERVDLTWHLAHLARRCGASR